MYPTADEIRERRALIQEVRELGTPEALADAQALQTAFHDEQMDILSKDTYWSAMGNQAPPEGAHAPAGWLRASEHLDLLREQTPGLADKRSHTGSHVPDRGHRGARVLLRYSAFDEGC